MKAATQRQVGFVVARVSVQSRGEDPPLNTSLSDAAVSLLQLHAARKGDIAVDDSNREAYRELARAGLMIAGHSFTEGREAFYRLTEIGHKIATATWLSESASPHR